MFRQLSRFSTTSPWLFLMYIVVLPFLFTLCMLTIFTTTTTKMTKTMALVEDLNVAQHLLQRSARDTNADEDDDGGGDYDGSSNETESDSAQFGSQLKRDGAAEGISIGTFLGNISAPARAQLHNIVNNASMTKKEMSEALDAWAHAQGQLFNTVYLGLKAAYESARQQLDQRHAAQMQNQTQAVREADAKIQTIANNQFITLAEEKQQMVEQMAKFPADVQQTLLQFAPYPYNKK
ncbi:hypothetical protein niasHT_017536 [Heterodera trifolii]|uniref:SXP/RAL-2 family protein Ani s 5-like cation-binding domain-containing protein n=1 Tax=Heterodera trifolii TaxID=157864 RepID=A0ABD2L679_9BILA